MAGGGGGCGNETAAHHSILWAGGIPSVWMASLLFCCLVLFTTVWEYLTELLEHRVAGHHGYQELLDRISHVVGAICSLTASFEFTFVPTMLPTLQPTETPTEEPTTLPGRAAAE